jgi:hypothetical protein
MPGVAISTDELNRLKDVAGYEGGEIVSRESLQISKTLAETGQPITARGATRIILGLAMVELGYAEMGPMEAPAPEKPGEP